MSGMDVLFLALVAIAFTSFSIATAYVSQRKFRPELPSAQGNITQDNTRQRSAA